MCVYIFFFNDTATTEIYTLSLHDALPIWAAVIAATSRDFFKIVLPRQFGAKAPGMARLGVRQSATGLPSRRPHVIDYKDRKSTRLNSSHANISYAVFCLKKKNISNTVHQM